MWFNFFFKKCHVYVFFIYEVILVVTELSIQVKYSVLECFFFFKYMKMLGYLTVVVCSSVILISTYEIMEKIGNSVLTFYGFVVGWFFLSAE